MKKIKNISVDITFIKTLQAIHKDLLGIFEHAKCSQDDFHTVNCCADSKPGLFEVVGNFHAR